MRKGNFKMDHTAQEILREALLSQMEKEASEVPPTEQILRIHKFSDHFLKYMEQLKRQGEKKQKKVCIPSSGWKNSVGKKSVMRFAAACIVCVIVVGSGWWGLQTFFGGGQKSADNTSAADASYMENGQIPTEEESGQIPTEEASGETEAYENAPEMWITADDISAVEVIGSITETAPNKSSSNSEAARESYANEEQTQELVMLLNRMTLEEVVSADETDDLPLAEFLVTKADKSVMNISVYDEKILIDGVKYEAEQEICEQLMILAEDIQKTTGEE